MALHTVRQVGYQDARLMQRLPIAAGGAASSQVRECRNANRDSRERACSAADYCPHENSKPLAKMRPIPPTHIENSDVLPSGSVAVDATAVCPAGTPLNTSGPKLASPLAFDVTLAEPRIVRPSPKPDRLQSTPEKNSTRYCVFATLLSVPVIVALPPLTCAEVMTG